MTPQAKFNEIIERAKRMEDEIIFKEPDWRELLNLLKTNKNFRFEFVEIGREGKVAENKVSAGESFVSKIEDLGN